MLFGIFSVKCKNNVAFFSYYFPRILVWCYYYYYYFNELLVLLEINLPKCSFFYYMMFSLRNIKIVVSGQKYCSKCFVVGIFFSWSC